MVEGDESVKREEGQVFAVELVQVDRASPRATNCQRLYGDQNPSTNSSATATKAAAGLGRKDLSRSSSCKAHLSRALGRVELRHAPSWAINHYNNTPWTVSTEGQGPCAPALRPSEQGQAALRLTSAGERHKKKVVQPLQEHPMDSIHRGTRALCSCSAPLTARRSGASLNPRGGAPQEESCPTQRPRLPLLTSHLFYVFTRLLPPAALASMSYG